MAISDYLQHFLGSFFLACCYFIIQVDFNEDMKKQKKLYMITAGVFFFALFLSYFLIKVPSQKAVSFGENDIQEYDDDDGGAGEDEYGDDYGPEDGDAAEYDFPQQQQQQQLPQPPLQQGVPSIPQ